MPATGPRRTRRRLAVAAVLTGVVVLGGAGYAAAAFLSGAGPQPATVLPADTLAFVTLDLDPSAGQKIALMSLTSKFPGLDTQGDGDLRGQLLQPLLDLSENRLDYAADVEPWLGDRMAVAAVPAEDSVDGVVPVVALAVTDQTQMAESLTRARQGSGFGFAVRDDYVLITDTQERADTFAAAEQTLADDLDFAGDREALGGDQIALAWVDLSGAQGLIESLGASAGMGTGMSGGQQLSGRAILGVHAESDAVEMVGMGFGVSDAGTPSSRPTRLSQGLPADTLAALAVSGIGDSAVAAWGGMQESGALAEFEGPLAELGLDLPDDLRTLLGSDLVVAAFGDPSAPRFGLRVVTDDGDHAAEVVDQLLAGFDTGLSPVPAPVDDGFVLGSDATTAQALAAGDGGLWDTPAFQAAVANPDSASAIGYVNLAAIVDQLVAQGGATAEGAANYSAVEALGYSATSTAEGGRIVLRITTR